MLVGSKISPRCNHRQISTGQTSKKSLLEMVGPFLVSTALVVLGLASAIFQVLVALPKTLIQSIGIVLHPRFPVGVMVTIRSCSMTIPPGVPMLRLRVVQVMILPMMLTTDGSWLVVVHVLPGQDIGRILLLVVLVTGLIPVTACTKIIVLLSVARVLLKDS